MADEKQLERLRAGAEVWNKWREENPRIKIDLRGAHLIGAHLSGVHLSEADLRGADLYAASLPFAVLREADLGAAILMGTDLSGASLGEADLSFTNSLGVFLKGADLSGARLYAANLHGVNLRGADLSKANLDRTNLSGSDLHEANLAGSALVETTIAGIDLSKTHGLENVIHQGPSHIGTDTLQLSKGEISEVFLRGCGLSDWEIESAKLYKPDISNEEINNIIYRIFDLRARQAVQVSPLFISYSHADGEFVDKVGERLTELGVRYWRDVHDAKAGRLEKQIDYAMRQNPTVLLVLSKNSIDSDWVEHEARLARTLEKDLKRDVLCPVALDDSWKSSHWPQRLMEQIMEYNILDYSGWKDDGQFEQVFGKLIAGLDMFYKK